MGWAIFVSDPGTSSASMNLQICTRPYRPRRFCLAAGAHLLSEKHEVRKLFDLRNASTNELRTRIPKAIMIAAAAEKIAANPTNGPICRKVLFHGGPSGTGVCSLE